MTINDVQKLFDLLEQLYHGQKRSRDYVTLSIWETILKPWSYPEVRDAVIKRARVNRHFPDPSEIAEFLPAKEDKKCLDDRDGSKELFEKSEAYAEEIREKYHAAGLPTASEAKKNGIDFGAWCDMVDKAFNGMPKEGLCEAAT